MPHISWPIPYAPIPNPLFPPSHKKTGHTHRPRRGQQVWPVVTVHEHSVRDGHYPAFACIGPEVFLAAPPGIETGAARHEVARSRSALPAHVGTQRSSETAPRLTPRDAQEPRECTGIASKHALTAHFVNPTETGETGETASQRSKCIIPMHAKTQKLSETAPHSTPSDAQTPRVCTGSASIYALTAHFVHPTETGETANQQSNGVIPAHAGIQRSSKTDPHSAPSDAQTPPEMHRKCIQTCTDCALRAPHSDLRDSQPAIEMRHSRAGGNPEVVRNRPSFSAIGCPGAPRMHWNCIPKMH